jgi:hypothetical protein
VGPLCDSLPELFKLLYVPAVVMPLFPADSFVFFLFLRGGGLGPSVISSCQYGLISNGAGCLYASGRSFA